jgi:hypothetical protein
MNARYCTSLIFLVFLFWNGPSVADPPEDDPDLIADDPFSTSTSHDNIEKCLDPNVTPQQKQEILDNISRIQKIAYVFDPPKGGDNAKGKPDVKIARYVQVKVPELGLAAVSRLIRSFDSDACEATVRTSYPGEEIPDGRHIRVSLHYDVAIYDCGHFLGVPYKNYSGSSWADVRFFYVLGDDFKIRKEKEPEVTNRGHSSTVFGGLTGALLGMGDVIGAVYYNLQLAATLDQVADLKVSENVFLAATSGVSSLQEFTKAIDMWQIWPLLTDHASSGLVPQETANPKFILRPPRTIPAFGDFCLS